MAFPVANAPQIARGVGTNVAMDHRRTVPDQVVIVLLVTEVDIVRCGESKVTVGWTMAVV